LADRVTGEVGAGKIVRWSINTMIHIFQRGATRKMTSGTSLTVHELVPSQEWAFTTQLTPEFIRLRVNPALFWPISSFVHRLSQLGIIAPLESDWHEAIPLADRFVLALQTMFSSWINSE